MPYRPQLPPALPDRGGASGHPVGSPISEKPVTPVTAVTPLLNKTFVNPAVAWRVEAMQKQVLPEKSLPFLVARETPSQTGCCMSCSDPLSEGQHYRCRPCAQAAAIVVWGLDPRPVDREQRGGVGK